jgi:putative acetyltransferase
MIPNITIAAESPDQPDVIGLIRQLDEYQEGLYPAESNHFLDIKSLCDPAVHFLVARTDDGRAVGCGAIKFDARGWGELKRMFVVPEMRVKGLHLGQRLISELENEAAARGVASVRLETGNVSAAALAAYERAGYVVRGPFGDYAHDPLSVFMEKTIVPPLRSVPRFQPS